MKRIFVSLMTIVSVLCLCSCKEDIVQRAKNAHLLADDFKGDVELQFAKCEELEFGRNVLYYSCCEDFLYCLMPAEGGRGEDKRYKIVKYNLEIGNTTEITEVNFEGNDNYVLDSVVSLNIAADDIVVYCIVMTKSEDTYSDNYIIIKVTYDMAGNKKSIVQFEEDENVSIINKCVIDNEGNSYILTMPETTIESFLIKYDINGKKLCVRQMEDYGDEIEQCNGRIILYRYGVNKNDLGYYDVENDTYEPSQFIDIFPNEKCGGIAGIYNLNVLIMGEEHLYSYDLVNNELKALIDMKDNHIDSSSVSHVEQISDNEVIIIYSSDGYNYKMIYFDSESNSDVNRGEILCLN